MTARGQLTRGEFVVDFDALDDSPGIRQFIQEAKHERFLSGQHVTSIAAGFDAFAQ